MENAIELPTMHIVPIKLASERFSTGNYAHLHKPRNGGTIEVNMMDKSMAVQHRYDLWRSDLIGKLQFGWLIQNYGWINVTARLVR